MNPITKQESPWPGWVEMPRTTLAFNRDRKDYLSSHQNRPLSLALGIFDGLHLGHQTVIESAVVNARRAHGLSALLTFTPHPSRVLPVPQPTLMLMPDDWKNERSLQLGLDAVIWKTFDLEFAALPAEQFLPWLKKCLPALASIHVGANFRFGEARRGDVHQLNDSARSLAVDIFSVQRIQHNGEPISSSRIREELAAGDLQHVNLMLGDPYHSRGEVVPGKRLGRTIGFPTLNVTWNPEARPRYGVYLVSVEGSQGEQYPGVANYGLRPTMENTELPRLEVHLLGEECPFGEGDDLSVYWHQFLRPEQKFSDLDALKAQITIDVARANEASSAIF
jgi:riboflavin kinase/FMN adenylyltransferase